MKKLLTIFSLVALLFATACDVHHRKHAHKKKVRVHHTADNQYLYHDDDADIWYFLYVTSQNDQTYYNGPLADYRSAGASWRPVPSSSVPKEVQEQVEHEENLAESENGEQVEVDAENMDAAAVEVEIDVADNDSPLDASVDLGSDGTYDSSGYDASDSSSSSDSSDSSSSFDSSSDSSSSDSSSSSPD